MASSAKIAPEHAQPIGAAREGFTSFKTAGEVAGQVLDGVRANRLYILTHGEYAPVLAARAAALAFALQPATVAAVANIRLVEAEVLAMYEAASA
jgi:hypothetical protein